MRLYACPKARLTTHNPLRETQLVAVQVALTQWQMGRSKVFLKYWHMDQLGQRIVELGNAAIVVQKWVRRFVAVKKYVRLAMAYRVEQAAMVGFMRDMRAFSNMFHNFLTTVCEEDETRIRQRLLDNGEAVGPDTDPLGAGATLGADLFPKEKVPDFFSRKHQQTVVKNKVSARKWFRDTELARGAVAAREDDGTPRQSHDSVLSAQQQEQQSASWFRGLIPRGKAEDLVGCCGCMFADLCHDVPFAQQCNRCNARAIIQ